MPLSASSEPQVPWHPDPDRLEQGKGLKPSSNVTRPTVTSEVCRASWTSYATPEKSSVAPRSLAPANPGEKQRPSPRAPNFLGGAPRGFTHLLLSHRVSQGGVQSWEKQEFLLPTYLLLHKRKQPCITASEVHCPERLRSICKEMQQQPPEKKSTGRIQGSELQANLRLSHPSEKGSAGTHFRRLCPGREGTR